MNASVHPESSASPSLVAILRQLPSQPRILDLGGWFCPLHEATAVVDLMPYETRRGRLALEPLPGERFTRADWHQADFMAPGFRLPFDDKCCDFAYCGQTVEDLPDPARLLQEMMRVARAGFIRSPSRLIEQTRGVSDRQTSRSGFAHHHWILDAPSQGLRLCAKDDSLRSADATVLLPLRHYERVLASSGGKIVNALEYHWVGEFAPAFIRGEAAARLARDFVREQHVRWDDRVLDPSIHWARTVKGRLLGRRGHAARSWWSRMVELSQPYSSLPLA